MNSSIHIRYSTQATCGLLSRPEVTSESRERFLRQVVSVVDDIVAGKVPGSPAKVSSSPSPFTKTALDVAIDHAGKRDVRPAMQAAPQSSRSALDLSERIGKPGREKTP